MANELSADLVLTPIKGEGFTLAAWLTTFHLTAVVVDPFANQSSWILDTAARLLEAFRGAGTRVAWLVTGDADEAMTFLGPLAEQFLTFCDPQREVVKALGLERLPALVVIQQDRTVPVRAEGWHPAEWRAALQQLARLTSWTAPLVPTPGDPPPFEGAPALA